MATTFDAADNRSSYTVSGVVPVPVVTLSIASVSAPEGATLVFTITKTGTATGSVSVNYATSDGTAVSPSDYTAVSGNVTFLSTETTKTISVPTIADTNSEPNETLTMTLSGATGGASIATAAGTGTIIDNDSALLKVANVSAATEGSNLVFVVTRSGTLSSSVSVNYATLAGAPNSGAWASVSDFTPASGTLTFLAGETTQTFSVATNDNSIVEGFGQRAVRVTLSGPSAGANVQVANAQGSILDNDKSAFTITNSAPVTEGGSLVFTVTKGGNASSSASVQYATGGSGPSTDTVAQAGRDYSSTSGILSFGPGEVTKSIAVATIDNSYVDGQRSFGVNLSQPSTGYSVTTPSASGTIIDNDIVSNFAISAPAPVVEGAPLIFVVTRSGGGPSPASVKYATGGSGQPGTKFTPTSGTLTFLPGETTKSIAVMTIDNATVDLPGAGTVIVNLSKVPSEPFGTSTITTSSATGTIIDNDS